jgi:hypothetical protein
MVACLGLRLRLGNVVSRCCCRSGCDLSFEKTSQIGNGPAARQNPSIRKTPPRLGCDGAEGCTAIRSASAHSFGLRSNCRIFPARQGSDEIFGDVFSVQRFKRVLTLATLTAFSGCPTSLLAQGIVHLACHSDSYHVDKHGDGGVSHESFQRPEDVAIAIDYGAKQLIWLSAMPFAPSSSENRIAVDVVENLPNNMTIRTDITIDRNAGAMNVTIDVSSPSECVETVIGICYKSEVTRATYRCDAADKPAF